jgi:hypothetical protein
VVQRLVAEGVSAFLEMLILPAAFPNGKPTQLFLEMRILLAAFPGGKPTPLFLEMLYKPPRPGALQIDPNSG